MFAGVIAATPTCRGSWGADKRSIVLVVLNQEIGQTERAVLEFLGNEVARRHRPFRAVQLSTGSPLFRESDSTASETSGWVPSPGSGSTSAPGSSKL